MTAWSARTMSRTTKLLIDSGRAKSFAEANDFLDRLVLQVWVGPGVECNPSASAALLTVINAGIRAFRGGVHVRLSGDPMLAQSWGGGSRVSAAVRSFGGTVVTTLPVFRPTIVIGDVQGPVGGTPVLHATWSGWSGGVVGSPDERLDDAGVMPLAGALAGSIAVSECFQRAIGNELAGRRSAGIALWRPGSDWKEAESSGPPLSRLPRSLWLLGLGHLGQAYCWLLGFLPYPAGDAAHVVLQDVDRLDESNLSTSLLARPEDIDERKTRRCAAALDALGFSTAIIEKRFDKMIHRSSSDPATALSGFDNHESRRLLDGAGFRNVVDVGLGSGDPGFLDILLHSFPSVRRSDEVFLTTGRQSPEGLARPYEEEVRRQVTDEGRTEGDARCGVVEIAGKSAGTAFVGASAGALALSEILRPLHGGTASATLSMNLSDPGVILTSSDGSVPIIQDVIYI